MISPHQQMFSAVFGKATQQVQQVQQPTWTSQMFQCGTPPTTCEDWAFSVLCTPCATAVAKTEADKSNVCYNFMCWHPVASYSYIRHIYHLPGTPGEDCGLGICCMPCAVRHMYTESRMRKVPLMYGKAGTNSDNWHVGLFDCHCTQFAYSCFCAPCMTGKIRAALQPTASEDCCFNSVCIIPTAVYGQTRHEFGLKTDCAPMGDLCVPLWCFPCAYDRW